MTQVWDKKNDYDHTKKTFAVIVPFTCCGPIQQVYAAKPIFGRKSTSILFCKGCKNYIAVESVMQILSKEEVRQFGTNPLRKVVA